MLPYVHRRNHPMGPVGRVPPTFEQVGTVPPTFENFEVNKSPKCTPFGIKCSKLRRLLGRPRPRWGSLRRSPVPLVVRSFLPSAIAAVRLPHSQFPPLGRSSRSLPQQIAGPAADKIKGQAKAAKLKSIRIQCRMLLYNFTLKLYLSRFLKFD